MQNLEVVVVITERLLKVLSGGSAPITVLSVLALINLIGAYGLAGRYPRDARCLSLTLPLCAGLLAQALWIVGALALARLGLL